LRRSAAARKTAAEALHESQENYRELFESIDQGFCTIEVLFYPLGAIREVLWQLECSSFGVRTVDPCVILVADDEPAVLGLVSGVLRHRGYDVISAADGLSALHVCQERSGPLHLAVLDIVMPGMTGPELFGCLQVLHPKVEVLFMSGYQPEENITKPRITASQYIAKPFVPRMLVQRVNEILGNMEVCGPVDGESERATA
jgi:CheY-like chemotaxis protein